MVRIVSLKVEARGRDCQIRIPHVCNRNRETVVLCHPNNKSVFGVGTGQKPDDMFGAYACSACHDVVDGRTLANWTDIQIRVWFDDGIFRTQQILLDEGKIGEI